MAKKKTTLDEMLKGAISSGAKDTRDTSYVLKPGAQNSTGLLKAPAASVAVYNGGSNLNAGDGGSSSGGGGGSSAASRALAAANASARAASRRENDNTRALADYQRGLIDSFTTSRDTKLANIQAQFDTAGALLLKNYGTALGGLQGNKLDNEMAEGDASFGNVANAVRERNSILEQAAAQGAGETDLLRAQMSALRNYAANQGEVNRSFHDTLRSVNNSINSLNSDTATSRQNLFNTAESDKEAAWANWANQTADAWTQIMNIENANTNLASATSEAYNKAYGNAGDMARAAVSGAYRRQAPASDLTQWDGKGAAEDRALTSSNRAASVNLGAATKRPEGATLRKWE